MPFKITILMGKLRKRLAALLHVQLQFNTLDGAIPSRHFSMKKTIRHLDDAVEDCILIFNKK